MVFARKYDVHHVCISAYHIRLVENYPKMQYWLLIGQHSFGFGHFHFPNNLLNILVNTVQGRNPNSNRAAEPEPRSRAYFGWSEPEP